MADEKQYVLREDQIKPLAEGHGAAFATDLITVLGNKIGYMYRDEPDNDFDSGWRFMAGTETDDYMLNPDNIGIYDVNTIANYDPDIIPLLDMPFETAYERNEETGEFEEVEYEAME